MWNNWGKTKTICLANHIYLGLFQKKLPCSYQGVQCECDVPVVKNTFLDDGDIKMIANKS